jgi:peptidoglycan/LPS O-acetylase OafA/YrhL
MRQIKCLTSLRFFAAAMIVVFHSIDVFGVMDSRKIHFALSQAVSLFFVLSGFILTAVYPSLSGGPRIRDFYIARIARIWPTHFAAFLLLLGLLPPGAWIWSQQHSWTILVANLFLVHGWIPSASYYFSFNSVSWSISTELFFYLAFPFLISRLSRDWYWKLLVTFIFVVVFICLVSVLKFPSYNPANFSAITSEGLVLISPLVRILEFVCGMVVATLCLRWRASKIVCSSPGWVWTAIELGALALSLLSVRYSPRLLTSFFDGRHQYVFTAYANSCGSFPVFGLLIGVLSFERGLVSRFLSFGWLVLLGEISYSIYLIHQILVRWYDLHRSTFAALPREVRYGIFWIAVLGISLALRSVVEKPCQRWIRSHFRVAAAEKGSVNNS